MRISYSVALVAAATTATMQGCMDKEVGSTAKGSVADDENSAEHQKRGKKSMKTAREQSQQSVLDESVPVVITQPQQRQAFVAYVPEKSVDAPISPKKNPEEVAAEFNEVWAANFDSVDTAVAVGGADLEAAADAWEAIENALEQAVKDLGGPNEKAAQKLIRKFESYGKTMISNRPCVASAVGMKIGSSELDDMMTQKILPALGGADMTQTDQRASFLLTAQEARDALRDKYAGNKLIMQVLKELMAQGVAFTAEDHGSAFGSFGARSLLGQALGQTVEDFVSQYRRFLEAMLAELIKINLLKSTDVGDFIKNLGQMEDQLSGAFRLQKDLVAEFDAQLGQRAAELKTWADKTRKLEQALQSLYDTALINPLVARNPCGMALLKDSHAAAAMLASVPQPKPAEVQVCKLFETGAIKDLNEHAFKPMLELAKAAPKGGLFSKAEPLEPWIKKVVAQMEKDDYQLSAEHETVLTELQVRSAADKPREDDSVKAKAWRATADESARQLMALKPFKNGVIVDSALEEANAQWAAFVEAFDAAKKELAKSSRLVGEIDRARANIEKSIVSQRPCLGISIGLSTGDSTQDAFVKDQVLPAIKERLPVESLLVKLREARESAATGRLKPDFMTRSTRDSINAVLIHVFEELANSDFDFTAQGDLLGLFGARRIAGDHIGDRAENSIRL